VDISGHSWYTNVMAYFSGKYEQTLDPKYRLRIPTKVREIFPGEKFVLAIHGVEKKLVLFTKSYVDEALARATSQARISDTPLSKAIELWASNLQHIEEDSQGRFVIAQHLREYAGVTNSVIFAAGVDRVSVYAKEEYQKAMGAVNFAEAFAQLEIGGF